MEHFSADWLRLREPADIQARSTYVTQAIAEVLAGETVLRALDLAAGTGSNVRYLAEQLAPPQEWLLVDDDPALLEQVPQQMSVWSAARGYEAISDGDGLLLRGERLRCRVTTRHMDLALIDAAAIWTGRRLVAASALLDLVSERWLRALARRCRASGATVLFALTYDGRIHYTPEEGDDDGVRELVNQHQRTDKGFGRALGPDAATYAQQCFESLGYQVRRDRSDWVLPPESHELQRQLIEGWARVAAAIAPERATAIHDWRLRRLAHVEKNRSRLIVGHEDLAAWLPRASALKAA